MTALKLVFFLFSDTLFLFLQVCFASDDKKDVLKHRAQLLPLFFCMSVAVITVFRYLIEWRALMSTLFFFSAFFFVMKRSLLSSLLHAFFIDVLSSLTEIFMVSAGMFPDIAAQMTEIYATMSYIPLEVNLNRRNMYGNFVSMILITANIALFKFIYIKLKAFYEKYFYIINISLSIILLSALTVVFGVFPVKFASETESLSSFYVYWLLPFFIAFLLLLYFLATNIRYYFSLQENRSLAQKLSTIQILNDELRKFKHNYLNIIYGFGGIIEKESFEELRGYYKQVVEISGTINDDNATSIQKINNLALYNLLSEHIKLCVEDGIPFWICVSDEIKRVRLREVDLCQILGIFLDNAREAAKQSRDPHIKLDIIRNDEQNLLEFYIYNTFGQSGTERTNEQGRGKGLNYARNILKRYKHAVW